MLPHAVTTEGQLLNALVHFLVKIKYSNRCLMGILFEAPFLNALIHDSQLHSYSHFFVIKADS